MDVCFFTTKPTGLKGLGDMSWELPSESNNYVARYNKSHPQKKYKQSFWRFESWFRFFFWMGKTTTIYCRYSFQSIRFFDPCELDQMADEREYDLLRAQVTNSKNTVDGSFRIPVNSPVEVGSLFPIIYKVLAPSQMVFWPDFKKNM